MGLAIEARALTKDYGHHRALDALDLSVQPGTVFGVIGANGAGKTTTMRLLLDIIRPTSGEVRVLGEDPRVAGPGLRQRIGYLPGELRLAGRVKGRDLLRHFAAISGPVRDGTIERMAERLDVDLSRQVRALSKGNKQKLGLIQAFMHEPQLLVLDEPTSGLDPLVQQQFHAMVREASAGGQTVLLSSHVLSEIEQAADTVAILRAGRLVSVADVASLRRSAVRHVRIGVALGDKAGLLASLAALSGLVLVEEPARTDVGGIAGDSTATVHATLKGSIDDFVRAIARHKILDLVVEEPDLEEAVLHYYGAEDYGAEDYGAEWPTDGTEGRAR